MTDPRIAYLPTTIYLLPLEPLLLLPETALPVTITGPAARGIVEAALAAGGCVGIIQELSASGASGRADRFYSVGCLGRIVDLGRDTAGHRIRLEGVIRFRVRAELPPGGGDVLPRATVLYDEFAAISKAATSRARRSPRSGTSSLFKKKIVEFGRQQFGSAGALETMSPATGHPVHGPDRPLHRRREAGAAGVQEPARAGRHARPAALPQLPDDHSGHLAADRRELKLAGDRRSSSPETCGRAAGLGS